MGILGADVGIIDHESSLYQTIKNHFLKVIQVWSGGLGQHISLALVLLEERIFKGDFDKQGEVIRLLWLIFQHLGDKFLLPFGSLAVRHFTYEHFPCFILKNTQGTLLCRCRLYVYCESFHNISHYW